MRRHAVLIPVYPRWRGEHDHHIRHVVDRSGLSPLARGTPTLHFVDPPYLRFIPAGAGNTQQLEQYVQTGKVYPRWRGEHRACASAFSRSSGLSPLARGTPCRQRSGDKRKRFIPAGAGNTAGGRYYSRINAVYPRWRGEHISVLRRISARNGLSPLARGTPSSSCLTCSSLRFIPAGAGNTPCALKTPCRLSVYPRWRGEHQPNILIHAALCGLSPLARGTRIK